MDATVIYYGALPGVQPDLAKLKGPVLGHYAENDDWASPAAAAALKQQIESASGVPVEFHQYADTHHGFFNDTRSEVHAADASKQCWDRTRRAYQDILEREPDAAGMRTYRSRIIDDNWTEEQVREALRRSPEYRERTTMTPQKAADIVRRAYLSVLNREPDAASQGYVQRVLRDKWTEEDVARELRRSPEYRGQAR